MVARKTCPGCRKSLSAAAFNDSGRSADGLARMCRACANARRRELDRSRKERREPTTNLAAALRQGDIPAVRKLIRAGKQPRWDWICETLREGHLALAEMLLESGVERNVFTIASMGDLTGLRRRLRLKPEDARLAVDMEPSSRNVTPLHVTCASDWKSHGDDRMSAQVEAAELLTEHGADLNAHAHYRGFDAATPLFCACWSSENLALVRWLLDQGAVAGDRDFLAGLGHFQRHGKPAYDIAQAFLDWGLPVDGGVAGNRTPLQAFTHQAAYKTVAWLIAHGADVGARGPGGRTAAHFAAERNTRPATLEILVEAGADLMARDDDGRTPLDIAQLNEKARVAEWIEKRVRATGR